VGSYRSEGKEMAGCHRAARGDLGGRTSCVSDVAPFFKESAGTDRLHVVGSGQGSAESCSDYWAELSLWI
jgi:hypothetical protein